MVQLQPTRSVTLGSSKSHMLGPLPQGVLFCLEQSNCSKSRVPANQVSITVTRHVRRSWEPDPNSSQGSPLLNSALLGLGPFVGCQRDDSPRIGVQRVRRPGALTPWVTFLRLAMHGRHFGLMFYLNC